MKYFKILQYIISFIKGERNQLMIWGFTEFRTNKKNKNNFFNETFTRAGAKARLYLNNLI